MSQCTRHFIAVHFFPHHYRMRQSGQQRKPSWLWMLFTCCLPDCLTVSASCSLSQTKEVLLNTTGTPSADATGMRTMFSFGHKEATSDMRHWVTLNSSYFSPHNLLLLLHFAQSPDSGRIIKVLCKVKELNGPLNENWQTCFQNKSIIFH